MWTVVRREKSQRQGNHLVRRQEGMQLCQSSGDEAAGLDRGGTEKRLLQSLNEIKGKIGIGWLQRNGDDKET